ncbi:glycine oxidase ThiO [Leptolyngbya sp. NIES-2104]|uniref:glycine oxidase ThiO n=1 Tax=Leptolyngbya sp. NIES-2104 TaxID=1552121 RepID=UPI0006ECC0EB|nr:glycine oxidase ThiO [Leptolyngbya sp. NIES-2104]GAP97478.1 glycine oxidase ThiO / thiazole biosynthesis protein ThiG [Leptolyngbya sp. NIES-2104]
MTERREILIIGGGIIGLSIAIELKSQGIPVTILCRDFSEAATHAAAGMIAPQAEEIPPSPMLDLCLASRALYPDWIHKLESLTGMSASYWACGILAPRYQASEGMLDRASILSHQPDLSDEVVGGFWFPQDAQVDNRALAKMLWMAAQELGIEIQTGVHVERFISDSNITHLETTQGIWKADRYILATGAWSQDLLPIPVFPRKGQMLSVRVHETLPLKQVLYGEESYIVPRQNGRIIVGATSENVGFQKGNTAIGVHQLLSAAIRLYPPIQEFTLEETWYGFRPATPDELPILGSSPFANLTLATGHYRNGILLAPITAKSIADFVLTEKSDSQLAAFHWSRFCSN